MHFLNFDYVDPKHYEVKPTYTIGMIETPQIMLKVSTRYKVPSQ
jgi:hypothetical protein